MAQQWRLAYESVVYSVIVRGDGRQVIYRDDTDRRRFLDLFGREVEEQAGLLVLRLWFNE